MNENHKLTPVEEEVISITDRLKDFELMAMYYSLNFRNDLSPEQKEAFLAEYNFRMKFTKQPDIVE